MIGRDWKCGLYGHFKSILESKLITQQVPGLQRNCITWMSHTVLDALRDTETSGEIDGAQRFSVPRGLYLSKKQVPCRCVLIVSLLRPHFPYEEKEIKEQIQSSVCSWEGC